MSDNYRDGCPPADKKFGLTVLLVQLVYVAAWLSDLGGRIPHTPRRLSWRWFFIRRPRGRPRP